MPERGEGKRPIIATIETGKEAAAFEFKDATDAEEYLIWKQEVPHAVRRLVESAMKGVAPAPSDSGLPLTDQFLYTLGACLAQKQLIDLKDVNVRVLKFIQPLANVKTRGGYINVFETLTNTDVSWNLKRKIYDTQIKTALEWLADRDLTDLAKPKEAPEVPAEEKESEPDENDVPSTSEEARSSMETGREKKEGPPTPLFRVKPFFGGYYKQLVFENFDVESGRWSKEENKFSEAGPESFEISTAKVFFGKIRGGEPLSLPLPDDWVFDPENLQTDAPEGSAELSRNQDGLWYLRISAAGVSQYNLRAGRRLYIGETEKFREVGMTGEIPNDLKVKIEELKAKRFPKIKLKREIVKLIHNSLKYSNSPEAYRYYRARPAEYFNRIWEKKEADCKIANDLACRALLEIDKDFRYVTGFYVKDRTEDGDAIMHADNGHAWLEVWDGQSRRAIKLDATPKGDPTIDEDEQKRDLEGETGEGDYEHPDEELASADEAKKQLKDLKKKEAGGGGEKKKSRFDVVEEHFSELAECTPEQARKFLRALDRVREIKDETGVSISDLVKEEWRKIVEERKVAGHDYRGPVRMDEGDRLENPVEAAIDIRSREFNPGGFEKDEVVEKIETHFGGINVYFSFDLSGSMGEPDGASGRTKADVQRDVALLFVDGLMQCAYIGRQEGEDSDLLPLKIMVTLASDAGEVRLHLTDKWGPKEQWAFYSALTKLASGGTPTHKTLELIERDLDKELADLRQKNIQLEKQPIHYTAEISDGAPDDFEATETKHRHLKAKGMIVRSYTIGGSSQSADAAPPLSSFSELPKILGKDIVHEFKKLRPRKIT
ncbi:MAG: hypothetical protein HW383_133 [Candidatus Magasanikbacteria bacterium]|nr:hypothetical protein [Candidatus Magasanikbacteria bacterium]